MEKLFELKPKHYYYYFLQIHHLLISASFKCYAYHEGENIVK